MRCLQITLTALSMSNCSFYTQNEGPDTSVWMLILGKIRCSALHLAAWLPVSGGLVACHVARSFGDLRTLLVLYGATFGPPEVPPCRGHVITGKENIRWLIKTS